MPYGLVLTLPEHGHINATLPLVTALTRRGHRIEYFATASYRTAVEGAGARYRDYGDEADFAPPAHAGGLYSVMAYIGGLTEAVLPRLLDDLRREPPDYLLVDSLCLWGHLAARLLAIPAVTLGSVFVPNDAVVTADEMIERAYGRAPKPVLLAGIDALNTYLGIAQRLDLQYGVSCPDITGFFAGREPLNVLFTSRDFHPAGASYDDTYRFVGPLVAPRADEGSLALPDDGRPIVFVSMGTIFNDQPAFYRACFDALGARDCHGVVAVGGRVDVDALGPIPPRVTVATRVPQLAVLEHASVFLTHGGMNSVSEALWHGVPLVVFPQHGDQHLVAARAAELGAALVMTPGDVNARRVGELMDAALTRPELRRGAEAIARSFHEAGGAPTAADAIVQFVEGAAV